MMAHFADVDENNIVVSVLVVPDSEEHRGQEYLLQDLGLGNRWIKTSYNTLHNQHNQGGTPLRYNFASVGFVYDEEKDAFIPPQPYPSWSLDWEVGDWFPPKPRPDGEWVWSESEQDWVLPESSD
jgi:hypothetical protein